VRRRSDEKIGHHSEIGEDKENLKVTYTPAMSVFILSSNFVGSDVQERISILQFLKFWFDIY